MKRTLISLAAAFLALGGAARAGEPSEAEIKQALDRNPNLVLDVLRAHKKEFFDVVQEAAQDEQVRRQKEAAEAEEKAFDESFKNPLKPAVDGKAHVRGTKKAKYTLVEYSDFQCPYCGRGYQTVEALRKKYGDDLRFIYKNMPLPMHPMAMPAAQYFEAAALQSVDKAWALHDKMFQNQGALSEDFIKTSAKELGLDVDKLDKDSKSDAVKSKIEADINEAKGFDFTGTPGFLLNGIPVRGAYPPEKFNTIIDRLNGKKG
ncbi:MAG: thioredoxin domain-containing protein [Elusimicrobia bacterium]|nr:thioredoxin domain-containing protein [Elusimicrobiota bacterium]